MCEILHISMKKLKTAARRQLTTMYQYKAECAVSLSWVQDQMISSERL